MTQVGTPKHPRLRVTIRGAELNAAMKKTITTVLNRLLGLQLDLAPFYRFARNHPPLHALARQFRGMKPPRFTGAFEGIINAIVCQQLTLTVGIRLLNQIAATYGATMQVDGTTVHAFPQPRELASTSPTRLRKMGLSWHKSRAMIELAQFVVAGRLDPETIANLPDQEALERLQNVRGVGRWTAQYVLLRGLGRTHLFPGDDVGARNNLRAWLNLAEPLDYAGVQRTLEPWKGYGGLIYFHLLFWAAWPKPAIFNPMAARSPTSRSAFARLILTGNTSKCNGQPVPAVDADDGHGQVHHFLFGELPPYPQVQFFRHMVIGKEGDGLGPFQSRPLPRVKKRCLFPSRKQVQPLLAFTTGSGIFGVHINTKCATVDLRSPQADQLQQRLFQPAVPHKILHAPHRLIGLGHYRFVRQPAFHNHILQVVKGAHPLPSYHAMSGAANTPRDTHKSQ